MDAEAERSSRRSLIYQEVSVFTISSTEEWWQELVIVMRSSYFQPTDPELHDGEIA